MQSPTIEIGPSNSSIAGARGHKVSQQDANSPTSGAIVVVSVGLGWEGLRAEERDRLARVPFAYILLSLLRHLGPPIWTSVTADIGKGNKETNDWFIGSQQNFLNKYWEMFDVT